MSEEKKYLNIIQHYENCLDQFGDTHKGVDWPRLEDAEKRYLVMLGLISFRDRSDAEKSLLDFGCGTAHLFEYMLKNNYRHIEYAGLDISPKFVDVSKKKISPEQILLRGCAGEPGCFTRA